ncbi:uncharacterized protein AB675_2002 [Cyphellophora attinorum]|uniref:Extracellular serine-rich protein n=1 Tax=Cyphellophora attinorum TaxID=1664694 RepID=A0A0N0NPE6_9EURO|nr:uncharacterized protein AB675_2002 [Phialophora attinorum]KPI42661.1 hypothetical protein AB675_2002 [Phialophora attinorum]
MYTKPLLTSALLAVSVAATNPWADQPVAVVQAPPPAAYTPPAAAYTPPPMAMVHQTTAMTTVAAAMHTMPAAAPPAAPPAAHNANPWADVKGQNQLTVFLVSVGDNNGSLKYFPDTVHAPPGSVVQFQFHPKNHTVTESTFDAPCKAKDPSLAKPQRPGLKSGFVPVMPQSENTPVYNVLINDTDPIWIFCGQMPHCQRGMSMVINPPNNPEKTIQKYQEAAAKLPIPSPPAAAPPAAAPPAASPPPAAASPPPAAASPPSPPPAAASPASPVSPAPAAGSPAEPAPATFTGAASRMSYSLGAALVMGAVALL